MERIKLTGPGLLLILAVIAAGGIFLVDGFYLNPRAQEHQQAMYRDYAIRAEKTAHLLFLNEQQSLEASAETWAANPALVAAASGPRDVDDATVNNIFNSSRIQLAWIAGADGQITRVWRDDNGSFAAWPEGVEPLVKFTTNTFLNTQARSGMARLPIGPALAVCKPISLGGPNPGTAYLWLARSIDLGMFQKIGAAIDGNLAFNDSLNLPISTIRDDAVSHSLWLKGQDLLMVAWRASDMTGTPMGQFQASLQVSQAMRQATMGRRTALIVLSLSCGLAMLVIVGSHILVTGPVIRLLRRLRRLEAGEGSSKDLVRDLHGEPLLLARRLESAFDRLAYMSRTDQLTGLANRRHFEQVLHCFYNQARRYSRPLSLMVIDVDYFKAVNDTAGHQAGDDALKRISSAIETACRRADLPARFGGDEFAVLLPETAAQEAQGVAERIAAAVKELGITIKGADVTVSISVGVADLNSGEISDPQAMVALADRALYAAKERGRARIVQAHDLTGTHWEHSSEATRKVNVMCRKLVGLDNQFKDLFIRALQEIVRILEHRDPNMADHARKVQHYALLIGREMELSPRVQKRLEVAAMLHDVGMIAMPDSVLQNPGNLSEEQTHLIRRHPLLSVRIMEQMNFLEQEIPAVRYHHERFDGKGYPEGVCGTGIPLTARILAVADSFDDMTSPGSQRKALTREQALAEIKAGAGNAFDPGVVEAFLSAAEKLGEKLMDAPPANSQIFAINENEPAVAGKAC